VARARYGRCIEQVFDTHLAVCGRHAGSRSQAQSPERKSKTSSVWEIQSQYRQCHQSPEGNLWLLMYAPFLVHAGQR
jgi:hypothetical protein